MATAQRPWHVYGGARRCSGSGGGGGGRRAVCLALCFALWLMAGAGGVGAVGSSPARVAAVAGCTVTTTLDVGPGSLRQAITDANSGVCASPITFAIGTGAQTIDVMGSLPPLTLTTGAGITIDGTTQPGYVAAGAPLITVNRSLGGVTGITLFTVNAGVTVHLTALTVQNTVTGAIKNAGTLTVADSVIQNNLSDKPGAGIFNNAGTLTVTGSTLAVNESLGSDGGAIGMVGGTTTVRSSLLTGNIAFGGNGSGIAMAGGTLIVDRSTLTANTQANTGGGIYTRVNGIGINAAPTLYVTNSTLSGNAAFGGGGGIYAETSTVATFTNATITANTTTTNPGNGGGLYFAGTSATLANTIIAGNSVASGSAGPDIFAGNIIDLGHNVIGKTDGTPGGTFANATDYTGTILMLRDPGLVPLANNGGPTPTHALLGSSVAVNHGDPTICANTGGIAPVGGLDQRGVHRPQGAACDIGAFEYFKLAILGGTLPTSGGVVTLTGTGFQPGLTLTIAGTPVPVLAVSSDGTGLTARARARIRHRHRRYQ